MECRFPVENTASLRVRAFSFQQEENRSVAAVRIDTPSIAYGQSNDYRAHVILYNANIVGFENLTNLDALPAPISWAS